MAVSRPVELEDLPAWRAHVLVATADAAERASIADALRKDGHLVSVVEDGVELLEHLDGADPTSRAQLVLADVELDGFTGLEVLGMTDGTPGRPPIVLLSSRVDLPMRGAARQFGAAALVPKPFDIDELRLLVGSMLRPHYRSPACAA
ncbi:response regulator transcription factor [Sandaracinus amylolyticus]|uniref:Response regulator receiver protein n=1 Tax=Sandaracinus amylolyticus TaxID=927083 RepID=A0A0F6W6A2_9BACT|nr:response regulator [Sandaracinus amylolyticus]AKF08517.1 response regulator receiver protein [Sandaracinus amylolyticus]